MDSILLQLANEKMKKTALKLELNIPWFDDNTYIIQL